MATLTVSSDGTSDGREVHTGKVSSRTTWGGDRPRYSVALTLTPEQALGIAYDLLYQAVDAGVITGWNVQHPEADWLDGSTPERDSALSA